MEYVKFGNTGLDVSRICLGCMSFGEALPEWHQWVLNEERSREIIKRALELGINFLIQPTFMRTAPVRSSPGGRSRIMQTGTRSCWLPRSGDVCTRVLTAGLVPESYFE